MAQLPSASLSFKWALLFFFLALVIAADGGAEDVQCAIKPQPSDQRFFLYGVNPLVSSLQEFSASVTSLKILFVAGILISGGVFSQMPGVDTSSDADVYVSGGQVDDGASSLSAGLALATPPTPALPADQAASRGTRGDATKQRSPSLESFLRHAEATADCGFDGVLRLRGA